MLEDYLERWNEAERLFANRSENVSSINFKRLHRSVFVMAVSYATIMMYIFSGGQYRLGATDLIGVPVLAVLVTAIRWLEKKDIYHEGSMRAICLVSYYIMLLTISISSWASVAKGGKVIFFPLLLLVVASVYVDRFAVMIFFGIAVSLTDIVICGIVDVSMIQIAVGSDATAFLLYIAVYWAVLGIYTDDLIHNRALEEKSSKDLLTGLYNKVTTESLIREYLTEGREGTDCALLVMDFDNFKSVNDTYGHQIGDEALKRFGEILRSNFRNKDIIGRMGGDEFMLLMKEPVTEDYIIQVCNQVEMDLATSHFGKAKGFTCSIGVVTDKFGFSFDNLYRLADDALYESKARGKARYIMWHTNRIVPPDRRAIYIASNDAKKREQIRKICGLGYVYYECDEITRSLNEISLYGEFLETVFIDYQMPGMTKSEIEEYMASRPLYSEISVHDVDKEIADLE